MILLKIVPRMISVIASSMLDIWANDEGEGGNKAKKVSKPSVILAVEVEAPGCSFSPKYGSHHSLAQAVVEEMQKVYQNELAEPYEMLFTFRGTSLRWIMQVMMMEMWRIWAKTHMRTSNLHCTFEPAPTQVLLSEEINGSLRKLKGCSTFAKGRFKSPEMKMVDKSRHSKKLALINFLSVAFKLKDIYADGDGG
ncbi:hypothetical protein EZV62_025893 [Acer yangbiense]|uniref:Ribosome biogenesis protein NOP53 n=1 Tax=Acer yangbiense TaxID=1000413 RepID=A0A5C7GZ39_9ROSI|nr:hypothetical protein EZV62_025893 [Acer yangbiense]